MVKGKLFRLKLSFVIIFLIVTDTFSQELSLTNFSKTQPPKRYNSEWNNLNHSNLEFQVSEENGKLRIKEIKETSSICELNLSSGKFLGSDNGEWGGELTFKPSDSKEKAIEIKKGNIKYIFKIKGEIYFIEGLAHLSTNKGALYKLNKTNNSYSYTQILKFEDAPEAFAIYNDLILIASFQNFYVVKDFKKEHVFKNTFWSNLYPNSIAVLNKKDIFMGIRSGIVKLDLETRELEFYKFKQ